MAEKILIVDDEPLVRASIRCYLEDQGYEPIEASDADEALAVLERGRPGLILLDLRMPGTDGLDLLKAIRARWADVAVVIVSGAGQIEDVVEALRLGAWDYLFKPIRDLDMLGHAVHASLERARLLSENQAYRSRLEQMVAERTAALEGANASLQRKTVALEEVLATCRVDSDRRVTRAVERIGQFCRPALAELRRVLAPAHRALAERIESAIGDATSDTIDRMAIDLAALSPSELRVCDMIRRGMGSKEIALAAGIAVDTVETHRRNIRRKLKITNGSVNLTTYLNQRAASASSPADAPAEGSPLPTNVDRAPTS